MVPFKYDLAGEFSEGLAAVQLEKKWGFIDKTCRVIIPIIYEANGLKFSEGLTPISKNNKWGFINRNADLVIPFRYDRADIFSEGIAAVKLNGKWGYINKWRFLSMLTHHSCLC
jgi:hypothetical protein